MLFLLYDVAAFGSSFRLQPATKQRPAGGWPAEPPPTPKLVERVRERERDAHILDRSDAYLLDDVYM